MFRLVERTAEQGVMHHAMNPVRVYAEDATQSDRIRRSVRMCIDALDELNELNEGEILELGCGSGDICGCLADLLAPAWVVRGVDLHQASLDEAVRRHPKLVVSRSMICPQLRGDYQLVILCEVLEHLDDPVAVASGALRKSLLSVVSHPLDEPLGCDLSGGDHTWSFSENDHRGFFDAGGHQIDETVVFPMGGYRIILSRGHRANA